MRHAGHMAHSVSELRVQLAACTLCAAASHTLHARQSPGPAALDWAAHSPKPQRRHRVSHVLLQAAVRTDALSQLEHGTQGVAASSSSSTLPAGHFSHVCGSPRAYNAGHLRTTWHTLR